MKLPRDFDGVELVRRLEKLGFQRVHQTGSHIICRLELEHGSHTEPIPNHRPLKVGTLSSILRRIAQFLGTNRDELWRRLGF